MRRLFREEAMDQPDLDPELLAEDLRNLEVLNRYFGGRDAVRLRLRPLLAGLSAGEPLTVLDAGSGAGDLCRAVVEECRRAGHPLRLYSLDPHPQIQAFARQRIGPACPEVRFLRGDARRLPLRDGSVDLALCTLALHHFTDDDARTVLAEMARVTRRWAVVSDLRRGVLAYAAVWLVTRFTRNPMTRQDGPVSVQRAFSSEELLALGEGAGWRDARFHREAWFRMSLVLRK